MFIYIKKDIKQFYSLKAIYNKVIISSFRNALNPLIVHLLLNCSGMGIRYLARMLAIWVVGFWDHSPKEQCFTFNFVTAISIASDGSPYNVFSTIQFEIFMWLSLVGSDIITAISCMPTPSFRIIPYRKKRKFWSGIEMNRSSERPSN